MSPRHTTCRRRPRPGNALLEFVLTLPIIIFVTGLTIYMAIGMLTKQQTLVEARHRLFSSAGHGHWIPMNLEGWEPEDFEDDGTQRPRGTGEALNRLRPDVEPHTIEKTDNALAVDFWDRIWGNLPARHEMHAHRSFETQGSLWNFINRSTHAACYRDSSPWHYAHLDLWKVARSGPLQVIYRAFKDNLEPDVAEHFEPTREDIINRWFHAGDAADEEEQDEDEGED